MEVPVCPYILSNLEDKLLKPFEDQLQANIQHRKYGHHFMIHFPQSGFSGHENVHVSSKILSLSHKVRILQVISIGFRTGMEFRR